MKKCLLEECDNLTDNPKFCSLSCGSKHQMKNVSSWSGTKICKHCKRGFAVTSRDRRKKFCSRSCSASFNNSVSHVKHGKYAKGKICVCGQVIPRYNRKYCSIECRTTSQREKRIADWLSGELVITSEYGVSGIIREYLMQQAGYRCTNAECSVPGGWFGTNPVTQRTCLTIDHIDGDATNNSPGNLRVLCPNCHSMTPNFGSLNTGKSTRSYRYKKG